MKGSTNLLMQLASDVLQKRDGSSLEEQTASLVPTDMAYVLFCSFGVFLITPGIGLFYGGTLKRKNMVQILFQTYMVTSVIVIVWYLLGYSLSVSPTSTSKLMGNFSNAALHNDQAGPLIEGGTIPSVVNFCFNVFFPVATVQIFVGSIGERGRFLPSIVVSIIWVLVCYCPFAFWVWGSNGWLLHLGALDFAGGGPVHIASGVAAFCYSWFLGPRGVTGKRTGPVPQFRGHSSVSTFIGVTLIWAAWFCFNSGTLLSVNARTGYIFLNTILASSFACVSYTAVDFFLTGKYSLQAACEGTIVGLVNITPSCGFYWPWAAALTSVINAVLCRLCIKLSHKTGVDDLSVSGVIHGVGGIIGATLTGIFATKTVAGYDGFTEIQGGWIDGNFKQIGYQIASWAAIVAWTAFFTSLILFIVDKIPKLNLRASPEDEQMGMDLFEMAETVDEFGNDYEEFFRQNADKIRKALSYIDGEGTVLEGQSIDGSSVSQIQVLNAEKV